MSPPDGKIRFLLKNIRELQELGEPNASLPMFEAMKVSLTHSQFELAITQLTLSTENRDVAYRFLVEGKTAKQLAQEGVSPSRLSKILKRVIANYDKQIEALGLVSCEYMLDPQTAKLVRELEATKVSEAKLKASKSSKGRKKSPPKKPTN